MSFGRFSSIALMLGKSFISYQSGKKIEAALEVWKAFQTAAKIRRKEDMESLLREAIIETVRTNQKYLANYADEDGEIKIDADHFIDGLNKKGIDIDDTELIKLNNDDIVNKLVDLLEENLIIPGNTLNDFDYRLICQNLVEIFNKKLKHKIIGSEEEFKYLILSLVEGNNDISEEIYKIVYRLKEEIEELYDENKLLQEEYADIKEKTDKMLSDDSKEKYTNIY